MEDCGDVVGVAEPSCSDEARQQHIDIVMVRFSPEKFSRERAERLGLDGALGLVGGEPGGTDEGGPAVVLSGGGDGLVLGGELSDRAPLLLLGDGRLVRRELSTTVLQNSVEHASRGGMWVVTGVWLRVVVGAVERHIGMVRVPPSVIAT